MIRRGVNRDRGTGGGGPAEIKKKTAKDFTDALQPERTAARKAHPEGGVFVAKKPEAKKKEKKERIDISDILPKPGEERPNPADEEIKAAIKKMKADEAATETSVRLVTDEELAAEAAREARAATTDAKMKEHGDRHREAVAAVNRLRRKREQKPGDAEVRARMKADFAAQDAATKKASQSRVRDHLSQTNPMLSDKVISARVREESGWDRFKRGFGSFFSRPPRAERAPQPKRVTQPAAKREATQTQRQDVFATDIKSTDVISASKKAPAQAKRSFFDRLLGRNKVTPAERSTNYAKSIEIAGGPAVSYTESGGPSRSAKANRYREGIAAAEERIGKKKIAAYGKDTRPSAKEMFKGEPREPAQPDQIGPSEEKKSA